MLAAMAAFFMFTVMNVFAKLLSVRHSVFEIAFYRNLIACMPFLFMVFVLGRREILVLRAKPLLVGLRAVLGALSLMVTFAAFSLMPMADTTVLMFTSGPDAGEATGTAGGLPIYHASLAPHEYRGLLASHGFEEISFVPDDPACNGHSVWLARYVGAD